MLRVLSLVLFFTSFSAHADFNLPRGLSSVDQYKITEIIGCGLVSKVLDNPYPLGGHRGVELGLSTEYISTEGVATLGTGSQMSSELNIFHLSVGKGIYNNIDTFIYFTPSIQQNSLLSYGADFRYNFYQSNMLPFTLSARVYGGSANFSNLYVFGNYGADLIASMSIEDISLYFGLGETQVSGYFVGGAGGVTADQSSQTQKIRKTKSVAGFTISLENYFMSFEVDRFSDSYYSGKLGYRF